MAEDLAELERCAVRCATAAGRLIVDSRPNRLTVSTKSDPTDVVTQMDTAAEELVRQMLAELRPLDAVFGEERPTTPGSSALTWVIDPIDGTVNYLYDIPQYAVSVAVVTGDPQVQGGWRPLAGAVCDPNRGQVYHARVDGGAWVSPMAADEPARPLRASVRDELSSALLGTGFAYGAADRARQAEVLRTVLPQVRDIRRFGSAALELCEVAAGRLDVFYQRGLQAYDIAAAWLVVSQAGGIVEGWLPGSLPTSDLVLAGPPALVRLLRQLLTTM